MMIAIRTKLISSSVIYGRSRMVMKTRRLCLARHILLSTCFCLVPLGGAVANAVTYVFEGTVNEFSGPAFESPHPFSVGQTIRGSFTYEPATIGASGIPGQNFDGAFTDLMITIGSYAGRGTEYASSTIRAVTGFSHQFKFTSLATGPTINGSPLAGFHLTLEDVTGQVLAGKSLESIPPLSAFSTNYIRVVFCDEINVSALHGRLTSLTVLLPPGSTE